jgi:hypothetical protein
MIAADDMMPAARSFLEQIPQPAGPVSPRALLNQFWRSDEQAQRDKFSSLPPR